MSTVTGTGSRTSFLASSSVSVSVTPAASGEAVGRGDAEAGGADGGEAGVRERRRGGVVPGVGQDQRRGAVMEAVEGQVPRGQGERVGASGAGVPAGSERRAGQVDPDALVGRSDAPRRGNRRIRACDERRHGRTGLHEQADAAGGRLVACPAAGGDQSLDGPVSVRRGLGVRLIGARHDLHVSQGVARALIAEVTEWARAPGCSKVYWSNARDQRHCATPL